MKRRAVAFSPEARADLIDLYDWIAAAASPAVSLNYIERIEAYLNRFDIASERGALRDDIRPGLRTIGFERRLTIAFTVGEESMTVLRIFRAGLDWSAEDF